MKMPNFVPAVLSGALLCPAAHSQEKPAPPSRPQFEVASLKPNPGCQNVPRRVDLSPSPGRLEMPCVTLQDLIQAAFATFADGATISTRPLRIEGGPGWVRSQFYSLSAKAEGPARTELMAGPMLQALLEERFQLKSHRETREMPVYALTVTRDSLKMQPLAEDACTPIDMTIRLRRGNRATRCPISAGLL